MYKTVLLIFRFTVLIFTLVRNGISSLPRENSKTNLASSRDKDEQKPTSLPDDIWSEILARLPVEEIVKCRIVCKSWNELTRSNHFIDFQYCKTNNDPLRLIVQSEINRNSLLLLEGKRGRRIDLHVDRELRGSEYRCACNGMLCMEALLTSSILLFVINPLTSDYVKLPSFPYHGTFASQSYGFGFDQSSGKYKVVRVFADAEIKNSRFEIFTLGESSWRQLSTQDIFSPLVGDAVEWNGFLFWLGMSGLHEYPLLAFDLCNEEFSTISYLPGSPPLGRYGKLVVFGESLAVVKVKPFELKVEVRKITRNKVEGFHLLNEVIYDMKILYGSPKLRPDIYRILVKARISYNIDVLLDFVEVEKRIDCDETGCRWLHPLQFRPTLISPVVCNYNGSS